MASMYRCGQVATSNRSYQNPHLQIRQEEGIYYYQPSELPSLVSYVCLSDDAHGDLDQGDSAACVQQWRYSWFAEHSVLLNACQSVATLFCVCVCTGHGLKTLRHSLVLSPLWCTDKADSGVGPGQAVHCQYTNGSSELCNPGSFHFHGPCLHGLLQ